ncbi:MarC family protein [Rhodoblastus sp.]|uniref:MarC family protein n=1 Tax=Rhodoblastus sp. TaxID=1962975 RepID=UPI003F9DF492
MSAVDQFAAAFVTLIVVVEPFGLAPISLAATRARARESRAGIAARASLIAFLILVGAALIGERLLAALGISMAAFRIAGGLLLFSIASEMVLGLRIARDTRAAKEALDENIHDPAAFPLAIPLMAGPGAIAATLLLAGRAQGDFFSLALLIAAIGLVALICFGVCLAATRIEKTLGASGALVVAKLLGVLLAALAVQYVIDGARALLTG